MKKEDTFGLLGIIIAAIISVVSGSGAFDLWDCIVGIILLIILHYYKKNAAEKKDIIAIYSIVFGMCIILISGFFIELLFYLFPILTKEIASIRLIDIVLIGIGVISAFIYSKVAFKTHNSK